MGAPRQEISKWSTVCSSFSRSGWSIVTSALLAKRGTSKKDHHHTSTKFWLGVIRWVHELSKWPSCYWYVLWKLNSSVTNTVTEEPKGSTQPIQRPTTATAIHFPSSQLISLGAILMLSFHLLHGQCGPSPRVNSMEQSPSW
jgi:hypothetical protein